MFFFHLAFFLLNLPFQNSELIMIKKTETKGKVEQETQEDFMFLVKIMMWLL